MSDDRPLYRVREIGKQFAVVNRANERVSPFYRRRDTAEADCAKRIARAGDGYRCCLSCGSKFLSDGPHNRLCGACRTRVGGSSEAISVALNAGGLF